MFNYIDNRIKIINSKKEIFFNNVGNIIWSFVFRCVVSTFKWASFLFFIFLQFFIPVSGWLAFSSELASSGAGWLSFVFGIVLFLSFTAIFFAFIAFVIFSFGGNGRVSQPEEEQDSGLSGSVSWERDFDSPRPMKLYLLRILTLANVGGSARGNIIYYTVVVFVGWTIVLYYNFSEKAIYIWSYWLLVPSNFFLRTIIGLLSWVRWAAWYASGLAWHDLLTLFKAWWLAIVGGI